MIAPISNINISNTNFKGTVTYVNKKAAAESISKMPIEYQNALVDALNKTKSAIEAATTDDASFILDVYDYKQYDKSLAEYKGVVVGIGHKKEQPKYKGLPPEYFYAAAIDMSDDRYADCVYFDIECETKEIKDEACFNHTKEGLERLKSFFTRKHPKPVNLNGTKEDILNKLV